MPTWKDVTTDGKEQGRENYTVSQNGTLSQDCDPHSAVRTLLQGAWMRSCSRSQLCSQLGLSRWINGWEFDLTVITCRNLEVLWHLSLRCVSQSSSDVLLQSSLGNYFAFTKWLLVLGSVLSNLFHLIFMSTLYGQYYHWPRFKNDAQMS